jgi:hypothetical protein
MRANCGECEFDLKSDRLLVDRPNPRCEQLEKMSIGVPEIDARTARGPGKAALDGNAPFSKTSPPRRQTLGGNAEANVRRAACSMRWNCSERQGCTVRVGAPSEKKQHLSSPDAESTEAIVRLHHSITEEFGVELARTGQIRHVEASLQNCARQMSLWFAWRG